MTMRRALMGWLACALLLATAAAVAADDGRARGAVHGRSLLKTKVEPDDVNEKTEAFEAAESKKLQARLKAGVNLKSVPEKATCMSEGAGALSPFSVVYAGRRAGANGAGLYDFKVESWPDTAVHDGTGTALNAHCIWDIKGHFNPKSREANKCCTRDTAGAPRRLSLTIDKRCGGAAANALVGVLVDGARLASDSFSVVEDAAGTHVNIKQLNWPAANGPQASVTATLELAAGHPCAGDAWAPDGPCDDNKGCSFVLTSAASAAAADDKSACCSILGFTYDPFAVHYLAKKDQLPVSQLTAKFMVIGDVGAMADGNMCGTKSRTRRPFTSACRFEDNATVINQHTTARSMAKVAAVTAPQYIINTGDNFYEMGLNSTEGGRKLLDLSFARVYWQYDSLKNVPWLSVLGNHDHVCYIGYLHYWIDKKHEPTVKCAATNEPGAATEAECLAAECCYSPLHQTTAAMNHPLWKLERGVWTQSNGPVDVVMIDTNPWAYIHKAENEDDGLWNGAVPGGVQSVDRAAHLAALDAALAQPQGSYRWKIVVGHHTLLNYGSHGLDVTAKVFPTPDRQVVNVEPIRALVTARGVPLYLNGHDHSQQVTLLNKTHVVTSGAGAKGGAVSTGKDGAQPPNLLWPTIGPSAAASTCNSQGAARDEVLRWRSDRGFAVVGADSSRLVLKMYNAAADPQCLGKVGWLRAHAGLSFAKEILATDYAGQWG